MKRLTWMTAMVAAVALCSSVFGQAVEEGADSQIAVSALGNDQTLCVRAGWRPGARTEFGLEGLWADGVGDDTSEALGAAVYATYDVLSEQTARILSVEIPTTIYVGVKAGALFPTEGDGDTQDVDATAALISGVHFGSERVRLGMEAPLYAPNEWLGWQEFTELDDSARILVMAQLRF